MSLSHLICMKRVGILVLVISVLVFYSCTFEKEDADVHPFFGKEDQSLSLLGTYVLGEKHCDEFSCRAQIYFTTQNLSFPVYKDDVWLSCVDEYSKEPRKFLRTVCGKWYVDPSINREKKEEIILPLCQTVT